MNAFKLYVQPRIFAIGLLGMASGLPLSLTASTLSAWLKEAGVDKTTIGLFAAVATPYTLKFLWAPLMDGLHLPLLHRMLGRRRSWMLLTQAMLVIGLIVMAGVNPAVDPWTTAAAAFFIAFFSASQDIVVDAYRTERLTADELGAGVAMTTLGYRIGMLITGAGALYLADAFDWRLTYVCMAYIMAWFLLLTLLLREPEIPAQDVKDHSTEPALQRIASWIREYVVMPFSDFMRTPAWMAILLFIITYKLGDAFLGVMTNPFLLEIGFTKTEIGSIVKVFGFTATILGTFVAAWCLKHYSMFQLLVGVGLLHAITNLMFVVQAHVGADGNVLAAGIALENFTGGVSSGVFVVFISRLCHAQYTATQYALLSALAGFGRTNLSMAAGWISERFGWEVFFVICVLLALPSLGILWWLKQRGIVPILSQQDGKSPSLAH